MRWSWSDWNMGVWLDVSEHVVILVIGIHIYQWLRRWIYRWLEDQCIDLLLYYFMLQKVIGKILFDCNTMYSSIVHHIHSYCSLLLLSFTVYTITVTVTVLLLLPYHPSILVTWILTNLTELKNNINGQLTLELRKTMEETRLYFG